MPPRVSVIIPTLNAGSELNDLLNLLREQTLQPHEILVVDSASNDNTVETAKEYGVTIYPIERKDFNHGITRHKALLMTTGDYVCFMTQDAIPADNYVIENLIAPMIKDPSIALVTARQLPKKDATRMEQLVRGFNYPEGSNVRSKDDLATYGIKTFFASDTCAAYRRSTYLEMGGFMAVETNEDMLMAALLIKNGYKVAYESSSCVYHSHNFTPRQQYERNRLHGRFLAQYKSYFLGANEFGEGKRLVKTVSKQLIKEGRIGEFFAFGIDCAARLAGNRAGKRSVSHISEESH